MDRYARWLSLATLLLAVMALVAGCATSNNKDSSSGPTADGPRIAVPEESFDFGKVPLDKLVSHSFIIKNVGSTNLVILGEPPVKAVQGC